MAAWDALPVEEQERAIGRTKLSDLELPDDVKPANSHVALNTIVAGRAQFDPALWSKLAMVGRRRRRTRLS
jgi:deferrochelatase/peroxidase EfeB